MKPRRPKGSGGGVGYSRVPLATGQQLAWVYTSRQLPRAS